MPDMGIFSNDGIAGEIEGGLVMGRDGALDGCWDCAAGCMNVEGSYWKESGKVLKGELNCAWWLGQPHGSTPKPLTRLTCCCP